MNKNEILKEIGLSCTLLVGLTDKLTNELHKFLPTQTDNFKIEQGGSVSSNDAELNNIINAVPVISDVQNFAKGIVYKVGSMELLNEVESLVVGIIEANNQANAAAPQNSRKIERGEIITELTILGGSVSIIVKTLASLKVSISQGLTANCAEIDNNAEFIIDCHDKQLPELTDRVNVLFEAFYFYYKKMGGKPNQ